MSHLMTVREQQCGREAIAPWTKGEDTLKGMTGGTFLKPGPHLLNFLSLPNREMIYRLSFQHTSLWGHSRSKS